MRPWQREFRRRLGVDLVYPADEFYLAAGVAPPAAKRYDSYPQYENGIGMTRALLDDCRRLRRRLGTARRVDSEDPANDPRLRYAYRPNVVAPGVGAGGDHRNRPSCRPGWQPFGVVRHRFGVPTSSDTIESLRGRDLGDLVVLPRHALDHAGALFLDGATPDDVSAALATPIAFASTMSDLLRL